jgi:hypothetical protein
VPRSRAVQIQRSLRVALFLVALALVGQNAQAQSQLSIDTSIKTSQMREFRFFGSVRGFQKSSKGDTSFWLTGQYAQPLGDGMQLLYSPLPLGVRYMLPSDGYTQNTVTWNLDVGPEAISPRFTGQRRAFFNKRIDFLSSVEYFAVTPFGQLPSTWTLALSNGSEFKLTRNLRLGAYVGVVIQDTLYKLFVIEGAKDKSEPLQRVFPLTASVIYGLEDGWRVSGDYTYRGVDGRDQILTHIITMGLTKNW